MPFIDFMGYVLFYCFLFLYRTNSQQPLSSRKAKKKRLSDDIIEEEEEEEERAWIARVKGGGPPLFKGPQGQKGSSARTTRYRKTHR